MARQETPVALARMATVETDECEKSEWETEVLRGQTPVAVSTVTWGRAGVATTVCGGN